MARSALWRGLLSLTFSALFVAAAAAALAAVVPEVSRITLFAEFSLLAVALPAAMLFALGYGETHRRPALDPCAGPPWMPERFWVVISALRDRAFRLHGWIAAVSIAACTFTATERALEPALVMTRAESLASWLAATLALFAGVVVAITNEALTRRLRTAFRTGVTDYTATLMARFHGATGLLTVLIAALFFQGDADFLTRLAVATIVIPALSWAATTGFCAVMLAWPLRAVHRGTFWLFIDTDARARISETYSAAGSTWSGGPVVVVCSPPDGTRGEHRLACALAGETDALRIESRADIDAWLRNHQPQPAHWTASPRRLMFVEPALLDTVRERCVRKGDSVALLTADGALAERWRSDAALTRDTVSSFAGDDQYGYAAHIDEVYAHWTDTQSKLSARPIAAAKRSMRPLLSAQFFERFASFALYAQLLQAVMGATPQPGYNAETVFLIPQLYVVGLLIAGFWPSVGDTNSTKRELALHGVVTGLLFGALGISALLTRQPQLFNSGLVATVVGIALYRCATTSLLAAAYDDFPDTPQRSVGFAALFVVGPIGAALGTVAGFRLQIDEAVGFALVASALCLVLALARAPLHGLPSLMHFLRARYLFSVRNLMLVACTWLLSTWSETHLGVLCIFLIAAENRLLEGTSGDDTRSMVPYQIILLLGLFAVHFGYWVCIVSVDHAIGNLIQDVVVETSLQLSPWVAWQPAILLATFALLVLRRRAIANHAPFFLGAGLTLSAFGLLIATGLDWMGIAAWSPRIGTVLAVAGHLIVAATGLTLLHELTLNRHRNLAIAFWLATPIIAAYTASKYLSDLPTDSAVSALFAMSFAWVSMSLGYSSRLHSTFSSDEAASDTSHPITTGSRNQEPR